MSAPRKLEGLKQIVSYSRWDDPRTLKKYAEHSGFPLRVEGDSESPRPRYFAFTDEIDHWEAAQRSPETLLRSESQHEQADRRTTNPRRRQRTSAARLRPWKVDLLLSTLLLLAAFTALRLSWLTASPYEVVPLGEIGSKVVNRAGRTLWQRTDVHPNQVGILFNETARSWHLAYGSPDAHSRFDRDRRLELLELAPTRSMQIISLPDLTKWFPDLSRNFALSYLSAEDVDRDGTHELIVTFNHNPNDGAFTVLWDTDTGRTHPTYISRGHHYYQQALDVDGDGDLELLFEGPLNDVGWFRGIAAVELPHHQGIGTDSLPAAAPTHDFGFDGWNGLHWFALVPPYSCMSQPGGACWRVDQDRKVLRLHDGTAEVGFDGFTTLSSFSTEGRRAAFRRALRQANHARKLMFVTPHAALSVLDEASAESLTVNEPLLDQWLRNLQIQALIFAGEHERAKQLLDEWFRAGQEVPSQRLMWFEVARAYHASGALEEAYSYYERGLRLSSKSGGAGRPDWESLRGAVAVLVELDDADRLYTLFASVQLAEPTEWFEELRVWSASMLGMDLPPELEPRREPFRQDTPDLRRYWRLASRLQELPASQEALEAVEREYERSSHTRQLLRGLQGQLLAALGDPQAGATGMRNALADAEALALRRPHQRPDIANLRRTCQEFVGEPCS